MQLPGRRHVQSEALIATSVLASSLKRRMHGVWLMVDTVWGFACQPHSSPRLHDFPRCSPKVLSCG
jgi:hypothetical protein